MKVYHGSDTRIEYIDFNKCNLGKDFGRGFYVTKLHDQAVSMAVRVAKWNKKTPIVSEFDFDEFALVDNDLKKLHFADYTDEWLDFVVLNRKNKTGQQAYLYLKQYGGVDFLGRHWWALHTDNPFWSIRDLYEVCNDKGGAR